MSRVLKLEGLNLQILQAIGAAKDGYLTQADLARKLSMSPQLAFKKVNLLAQKGYLKKVIRGIVVEVWLTELGLQVVSRLPTDNVYSTIPAQPKEPTIRPHALEVKFPLKDAMPQDTPTQMLKLKGLYSKQCNLKNQEGSAYFAGEYEGLLMHDTLVLYGPDLPEAPQGSDVILMERDTIRMMFELAEGWERRTGSRLRRDAVGMMRAEVVEHDFAFKNHPIAKDARKNNAKLYGYHPETKELIVITDFSHGFPEFEMVSRRTAPYNAEEANLASVWMATGGMRAWAEETHGILRETIELARENTASQVEQRKFEKSHNELVKEATRLIKELRQERKDRAQRRLP